MSNVLSGGNNDNKSIKNTTSYNIASTKEIEKHIINILSEISKLRLTNPKIPPFVFIVDELDKVEPDYYFAPTDRESSQYLNHNQSPFHITTKARKRQEAIAKLLANLKNFLNDADAKFVFIGGRGMYDAALADIADRESFYSSIFHEVFYVESFFKDRLFNHAGLSQITESYLCSLLMKNSEDEKGDDEDKTKCLITYLIKKYECKYLRLDKNGSEDKEDVKDKKGENDKTTFVITYLIREYKKKYPHLDIL